MNSKNYLFVCYRHFIPTLEAGAEYRKARGGKKKQRYLQSCRDVLLLSLLACPTRALLFYFVNVASTPHWAMKLPNHRLLLGRARIEPSA